eukprot:666146-Hanusia_phi.AAC.1
MQVDYVNQFHAHLVSSVTFIIGLRLYPRFAARMKGSNHQITLTNDLRGVRFSCGGGGGGLAICPEPFMEAGQTFAPWRGQQHRTYKIPEEIKILGAGRKEPSVARANELWRARSGPLVGIVSGKLGHDAGRVRLWGRKTVEVKRKSSNAMPWLTGWTVGSKGKLAGSIKVGDRIGICLDTEKGDPLLLECVAQGVVFLDLPGRSGAEDISSIGFMSVHFTHNGETIPGSEFRKIPRNSRRNMSSNLCSDRSSRVSLPHGRMLKGQCGPLQVEVCRFSSLEVRALESSERHEIEALRAMSEEANLLLRPLPRDRRFSRPTNLSQQAIRDGGSIGMERTAVLQQQEREIQRARDDAGRLEKADELYEAVS